ncbi:MAG: PH domain-containing protein [Alphaproteobacteria bacterium]|nr:PH domain-containing protein [Alphaproteobacteria bacterium]MBQ9234836.1 PH domain-containing protein [Alphaproteobacteria bacterium]
MRDYVQNTLQLDEEVLMAPKLHWAVYIDTYFQLSLLYILFCHFMAPFIDYSREMRGMFELTERVVGLLILLRIMWVFVRNMSVEMAVTNYRVVYKIGVLNVRTEELVNDRIEAVSVRQSIMGRILNYGDILFSGTGTSKVVFRKVYAPWWIKSQVEDILRQSSYYRQNRSFDQARSAERYY